MYILAAISFSFNFGLTLMLFYFYFYYATFLLYILNIFCLFCYFYRIIFLCSYFCQPCFLLFVFADFLINLPKYRRNKHIKNNNEFVNQKYKNKYKCTSYLHYRSKIDIQYNTIQYNITQDMSYD